MTTRVVVPLFIIVKTVLVITETPFRASIIFWGTIIFNVTIIAFATITR